MNATTQAMLVRTETFPGAWVERWQKGTAASARIRLLRSKLPTVRTNSTTVHHRWTSTPGSDRTTIQAVEIHYFAAPHVAAAIAP